MAVAFLDEMVDRGISPKKRHYVLVVEACERAGEMRLAQEVGRRWAQDKERLERVQQQHQQQQGGGAAPLPPGARLRSGTGPKYPFQPRR